ncbi:MAG: UDP-N-acetyl-D-mannosamine dehydrogenase [Brevundimonas sp.]|uniref:UDP-N-acetyl-D-mannosamine dehydrogenase n=1 Tax=Brevundimonas sp. TaxID=1871086 RepID=UPI00391922B9
MSPSSHSGHSNDERGFDRVCMVGLGYIGLPTAAVMASHGVKVLGVDVDPHVVETVNRGEIHIVEPLLDAVVSKAVASGCLKAATAPEPCDAFIIAVPTPITSEKCADLRYVLSAARAVAPVLKRGDLVVLESTSPVGATEAMIAVMAEMRPDLRFPGSGEHDIHVAYCPERVLPGRVVEELVSNDRAIGGMTPHCTARAKALYRLFVEGELIGTSTRAAELTKLAENAFRDVNIAFANELANVCDIKGIDVWEVIALANRHPRVNILRPGPGVGGHCIAVDPWFIVEAAPHDTPLIKAARTVNDARPHRVLEQVSEAIHGLERPVVACLGLAFKPDIDDLRESPAVEVAMALGARDDLSVLAVEPNITTLPEALSAQGVKLVGLEEAMGADLVLVLVDHTPFKRQAALIDGAKRLIDTRGITPWRAGALRS